MLSFKYNFLALTIVLMKKFEPSHPQEFQVFVGNAPSPISNNLTNSLTMSNSLHQNYSPTNFLASAQVTGAT